MPSPRRAEVVRETGETRVRVEVSLEPGEARVSTGYRFLDHMVETLLYYMGASGVVEAVEKKPVDDHHVVEDVALALGEALRRIAAQAPIARFGFWAMPMDEALALVAVDVSGRPGAFVEAGFTREYIGDVAAENIPHFIQSLASSMRATIHARVLAGSNNHHVAEALFKGLGKALGQALSLTDKTPSTKGVVEL